MVTWSRINSFSGNGTHPVLTGPRPCPVCNGRTWKTVHRYDEFLFYTDSGSEPKISEVQEVQCSSCFTIFRNPCFTEYGFNTLFAEAGQSYGSTEGRPIEQVEWLQERDLLAPDSTVFDLGCYYGVFLNALPDTCQRFGVEIDKTVVEQANERNADTGVTIVQGAFNSFESPANPDLITMFHVLEHVPNPKEVLIHLREISHPGTRLIIEVPIVEHGRTNDIHGFFSIQHLTHFSRNSLTQLFAAAGWDIVIEEQMPDYNGHRVALKPSNEQLAPVGDVADRLEVRDYMAAWYSSLGETNRRMHEWTLKDRVAIWGGGMHTEMMYQTTDLFVENPTREFVIIDSDPMKKDKTWRGIGIYSSEAVSNIDWSTCSMVISSYGSQEKIADVALSLDVPESVIHKIYATLRIY